MLGQKGSVMSHPNSLLVQKIIREEIAENKGDPQAEMLLTRVMNRIVFAIEHGEVRGPEIPDDPDNPDTHE